MSGYVPFMNCSHANARLSHSLKHVLVGCEGLLGMGRSRCNFSLHPSPCTSTLRHQRSPQSISVCVFTKVAGIAALKVEPIRRPLVVEVWDVVALVRWREGEGEGSHGR